jgi:chorismate-pyruvate lyase
VITEPRLELLHPLPALYAAAGRALPEFELVDAAMLPPAAHRLLVHAGDMTSKLEEFFAEDMWLRVLQCEHTAEHYRREVILYGDKSGFPVEYGAIEINLQAFAEDLRAEIVSGKLPLGGLLNRHGIRYRSEPRAFLRVSPCARMTELFELHAPSTHYARSNRLLDSDGNELAEIVEILRPV